MTTDWPSSAELADLRAALAAMPELRRSVYLLCARDGADFAAIAACLGLTIPEVERSLAEALVDLMRALDGL